MNKKVCRRPERRNLRRMVFAPVTLALGLGFLAGARPGRADTPAQTRQAIQGICDRVAAGLGRQDMSAYLAMHSPDFTARNVAGRKQTLQQEQASIAKARNYHGFQGFSEVAHCLVSPVVVTGDRAKTVLHWSYITHHLRLASAPAYMAMRTYDEDTVWKKGLYGWKEVAADMTRDATLFKR